MTYLDMDFVLVSCPLKSPKFNSTREQADEGSRPMLGVNCSCFSLCEAFGDAQWTERSRTVPPNFYSFMKQLKFRTFIIAMLLASAMGVSAEKVEAIVGDLKYEIDTETKEASVIKGDYSSLYIVTIPEKIAVEGVDYAVTSIGDNAFYNLSKLTSVTLSNSVKSIGKSSYCDIDGVLCNKTKQILYQYPNAKGSDYEIPNTITKIEEYAFSLCKDVESLTIPASVGSIEYRALEGCSNLRKITCLRTNPISANFASSMSNRNNILLFVPKESVDAYKNAKYWKDFIIKAIGSVAESLTLNNSELTLNEGETYQLTYTVLPETADAPTVEWTSSNPEIATVDENGKVTAIALGSATITVKTTDGIDIASTCNVTVQESPNTDITTMDDVIYVDHAKALTGKSVTLSLKMKHEMKVAGFQFNLVLPENFTIENVTRGEGIKGLDDDDEYIYTFNNSDKEDGSRFFLCYSTTNTAMPEGDIEIAKVVVNVPEGIEPGEYGVILKNAELAYGTEKKVIDYVKGSISVTDYIIGDANNDGIISVVDITAIGQYLLDGDKTNINLAAADANGDGVVSVADITTIAVMILNAENTGVNEGIIEGNEQLN